MSLEPPSDKTEVHPSVSENPVTTQGETPEAPLNASISSHQSDAKITRFGGPAYGRILLGVGVFAGLSGGILLASHMMMPASSMGGHDGHDMSGMLTTR